MTQPVDVPLLAPWAYYVFPAVFAARCFAVALLVGAVATFALGKGLGRFGVAARWRAAFAVGGALFLAIGGWSWLASSEFTVLRVTPQGIELRYANWPWPARRFTFDEIDSVSMTTWGRARRSAKAHGLAITTKTATASGRTYWESAAGDEANIVRAMEWIEHASGGRLARQARP
jgi:hypothetical protein